MFIASALKATSSWSRSNAADVSSSASAPVNVTLTTWVSASAVSSVLMFKRPVLLTMILPATPAPSVVILKLPSALISPPFTVPINTSTSAESAVIVIFPPVAVSVPSALLIVAVPICNASVVVNDTLPLEATRVIPPAVALSVPPVAASAST